MVENNYKPLKPFRGWVLENFPFIENDFDALTNYQIFCKIIEYINNIITDVTAIEDSIDDVIKLVNDIKAYVDEYLEDITEVKEEIEDIKTAINTLNTSVISINNELTELKDYTDNLVSGSFDTLKTYVDNQDEDLNEKIENIQIGAIEVYDPTTGEYEPLQITINNLYNLTNKDGITAGEFDALQLTASVFDGKDLTAYQFDSSSKTLLS